MLSVIAHESTAHEDDIAPIRAFIEEIIDSAEGGEVAVGNLNYDAVAMAVMCAVITTMISATWLMGG